MSARHGGGCRRGRGLGFVSSLALSPGGRFLYAGTRLGSRSFAAMRAPVSIVQLSGADGCVTARAVDGCARGQALGGVTDVALDRGGHNLYTAAGSVGVFKLAGGVPRQLPGTAGCISDFR